MATAEARDQVTVEDLILRGYEARRAGDLLVAGEALEQAVLQSKAGPTRRALAAEVAEFWLAQDKGYRAVRLYRRLNYVRSEVDTLILDGDYEAALAVARQVGYQRGEAIALVRLGSSGKGDRKVNSERIKQALKILDENDLKRDKADLLFEVAKRYKPAAQLYAELQQFYLQARCYELAGKVSDGIPYYSDAKTQLKLELEEVQPRLQRAIAVYRDEKLPFVARERARRDVILYSGKTSVIYEQLAVSFHRTGNSNAYKLVDKAIQYTERQRDTLRDGGRDKFGPTLARYLKLDERLRELAELKRTLQTQPPPK
ncbi:MAG: hypothetical protein KDD82_29645 [Planctomycetes bacterium]|nr:hypothetical protein [Planctomycetota bacterium]